MKKATLIFILFIILFVSCEPNEHQTCLTSECEHAQQPISLENAVFASKIVSVTFGSGAGYGQDKMPDVVLGAPEQAENASGAKDVLSLGNGGQITLAFPDNQPIVDREGPDFVVFENAFYVGSEKDEIYNEAAIVAVSQDGIHFTTFPFDYKPSETSIFEQFIGFAGISPFGDLFDLADVGLKQAKFIRITDCGIKSDTEDTRIFDKDHEFIDDAGNLCCGGNSEGFDLDAVAVLHY